MKPIKTLLSFAPTPALSLGIAPFGGDADEGEIFCQAGL